MLPITIQLNKQMKVTWGADSLKGQVPKVVMTAQKSLQIIIDEEKGIVCLQEGIR